ncbi:MAG TPA: metallopeptidase TldD-related protein [Bryobacteraceae bacterium]|nr:metallopeptidase TldD-related protein [Bryobacteraceae bacterium]
MKRLLVPALACLLGSALWLAFAADNGPDPRKDLQLRAMLDEIARAKTLQISNLDKPYFIAYSSSDSDTALATASLGGLIGSSRMHIRQPTIVLRVGDYKFDNTNSIYARNMRLGFFPIDDDYQAMRTQLWLSTDGLYKASADQITRKRAALREIADPDTTPDFSPASAVRILQPPSELKVDLKHWEDAARKLSARFVAHPDVLESSVMMRGIGSTYRLVNTEGSVVRIPQEITTVEIRGSSLAADGTRVWDHDLIAVLKPSQLPSEQDLINRGDKVAADVDALAKAPAGDDYTGPVLFEQEAAAQLMAQALTDAIRLHRKPISPPGANAQGSEPIESVWASRIGSKVLPEWLSIIDDPHQADFHGVALAGQYDVDDEGVPAERVPIVEKGVLKHFLLSRQPVRAFNTSNGHGRLPGGFGSEAAAIGNLFVQADETIPEAQMKAKLIESVKTAGLKYGILIRKIDFPSTANFEELQTMARELRKNGYARTLNTPILAYRIYPDGREELVRAIHFKEFSAKDLRDIKTASDRPYVLNYVNNGSSLDLIDIASDATSSSVICPSLLFDSIDLGRTEEQAGRPPIVAAPALTPQ